MKEETSPTTQEFSLKRDFVDRYDHVREVIKDIFSKFMADISRDAILRSASRLGVKSGEALLLNTAHETDFFFDYCIRTYKKDGLSIIQRGFNRFCNQYEGEKLEIFKVAKDASFAFLEILEPLGDEGLVVYDQLKNSKHLLIDRGLNKTARGNHTYKIVSHFMDFEDFIMTTGAATPVMVDTEEGSPVQKRFEEYLHYINSGGNDSRETAQYITDMFKICLEEHITGNVVSPPVPFGRASQDKHIGLNPNVFH